MSTGTISTLAAAAEVSLSWRLIGNVAEGGDQAELTLRNDGTKALTNDWAIYFNSASRLLPESVRREYDLTHINGDFYTLRPGKRFTPIQPGETGAVEWKGTPWAVNISDAPSGFYFVSDEQSRRPSKPVSLPLQIKPFPAGESLRRGAADIEPIVTAESRYTEDESLTVLPPEALIKVVPTPFHARPLSGKVRIRKSTTIFWDPPLDAEAKYLAAALEAMLGAEVRSEQGTGDTRMPPDGIRLRIGKIEVGGDVKRPGDEAYTLTATEDGGVEIIGSDPAGVLYGVQTLRVLLPIEAYRRPAAELTIDVVQIADAPRFRYRGLHLDVARNFQTKEKVKKLLELMAFYKLNRLHWHLTDDEGWRVEIKRLPDLTLVGGRRGHTLDEAEYLVPSHGSGPDATADRSPGNGFYTQADMIEVLQHARQRHITVIPEIDLPGHARAAVKAMEVRHRKLAREGDDSADDSILLREPNDPSQYESVQMWRDNVVDVGREDTYRFLALVVDELAEIYRRAGVPLTAIHLGGDEVPKGAWERSPACKRLALDATSRIPRRGQLELHFLNRASGMLAQRSIQPACWEDCLLLEIEQDPAAGNTRRAANKPTPTAYVWNNVWGWGREDAAYRLANAGFDVVLCNATHLYFDLACEKDPLEPGYYWAGFVDARKPFEFAPLDVFQNADRNSMGQPVNSERLARGARLTDEGARHVLGIQGQLWGENLRDSQSLEYMAFPRVIALAERAWARSPEWASTNEPVGRHRQLDRDWNQFANRLGQRELPRLDYLCGGVHYRLPPPGAAVRNGLIHANVAFPGVNVRYTDDGSEPNNMSALYREPVPFSRSIKLKSFNSRGRGSRTTSIGLSRLD